MTDVDPAAPAPTDTPAPAARTLRVVTLWLSEASKERISEHFPVDLTDELEDVPGAELVCVSTRIPKVRVKRVMAGIREQVSCPVVVICHAGGEADAIELMELGASTIVAEGNEPSLANLLDGVDLPPHVDDDGIEIERNPEALVSTFAQRLDANMAGSLAGQTVDPVTGLMTSAIFELRFADMAQRNTIPRLMFLRVANPRETLDGLDRETIDLLRRRVAMLFNSIVNRYDADLYEVGDLEYVILHRSLSSKRADELGEQLTAIARSFTPNGTTPLEMGVGHAGSEVAAEPKTLRDLANRAIEAAINAGGTVVSADDLSRSQASTTELEAALRLAKRVDELDPLSDGHSLRVADYAVEIAQELGYDGHEIMRLRLACLLHDVGKIGLGSEVAGAIDPDDEHHAEYRTHVERGSLYARTSAGPDVAAAIRHHHESWDGSGFPDGLEGEDIPIAARIIAVADAYDRWTSGPPGTALGLEELVERLTSSSGVRFDETVVEAALNLFGG